MRRLATRNTFLGAAALGAAVMLAGAAHAQMANASSFNTPFGMSSNSQGNQPIDPSLRDSNGNLTMVNGEFTSSAFAQGYGMAGATASASGLGSTTGVGGGSGAAYGGATAIGNSLNVVTVGSGNTVIVNANQTNNGNQTANTNVNGQ